MPKDNSGQNLLNAAKAGDFQALAKFLTWIERSPVGQVLTLGELLSPPKSAFRFGITGPPGAGKSTLVGQLIAKIRAAGLKLGVIAVDPSSPFTQGAILGDRIRYSEHSLDPGVFIRSLGTRGSLGGLSSAAFLMARAFDACGFDLLLMETVGVGQTELDILHVADRVGVVLVPESGDSIQAMKAGLMEIADVFVINKSDRPGADQLAREVEASIHDGESAKKVEVMKCVASEGQGVERLFDWIAKERSAKDFAARRVAPERLQQEAKALLRAEWEREIARELSKIQSLKDLPKLFVSK